MKGGPLFAHLCAGFDKPNESPGQDILSDYQQLT